MKDKISVIVPVYNVEKYIRKCINSIINQTYINLEIILVDDGSTDESGKICDEFAFCDNRIRVIHKENGGLSHARNVGIDVATGKYIMFVDSDDYIHVKTIQVMYEQICHSKSMIAVCEINKVKVNSDEPENELKDLKTYYVSSDAERIDSFFGERSIIFTVAWNKLYPINLFEGIRYPVGKIHEDEFVTYKLLEKVDTLVVINEPLYFYVERDGSIVNTSFSLKRLHRLDAYLERLNIYEESKKYKWFEKVLFLYRIHLLYYIYEINKNDMDFDVILKYRISYKKMVRRMVWKLPVGVKRKLGYIITALKC